MIAPNREIVNINSLSTFSTMYNSLRPNVVSEDVCMNVLIQRSNTLSLNLSREFSAYSSIFLVLYEDHMEAQNNNFSWADQMDAENFQLSYKTSKKGESNIENQANNSSNMPPSYSNNMFNISFNLN